MKIRVFYKVGKDHWVMTMLRYLISYCSHHEFECVKSKNFMSHSGNRLDVRKCIVFQYPDGAFDVIDPTDQVGKYNSRFLAADPHCRRILKCQFRTGFCEKCVPYIYTPKYIEFTNSHLDLLRAIPKSSETLLWRGTRWCQRHKVIDAMGLTHERKRLPNLEFLREIAAHRMMLALPGWGNVCHREFEGFAAGTAVLMPTLKNSFANALLPDVHYIAVETDTVREKPQVVARKLSERYEQVRNDHAFIEQIRQNAMHWYDQNCSQNGIQQLTAQLLGLDDHPMASDLLTSTSVDSSLRSDS